MLDPDLRRAQDVTGRVKRNPNTIDLEWLAVGDRLDSRTFVQAGSRDDARHHEPPDNCHIPGKDGLRVRV